MPRTAKIAIGALGLLALFLVIFYTYLRWNNYSALRDLIASRVQSATGQQLTFNGPVSLEMGADSFLSFRDVVLTNPDWQFLRSTITVDEGRIGLDLPNVIAGGIGTVVQLNSVNVTLDRPQDAKPLPAAPAPGTTLSAPAAPPLPKFDELRVARLTIQGDNILGQRTLQLEDLKIVPQEEERTLLEARAASAPDVALSIVTDEIDNGRAWSLSIISPRSNVRAVLEATTGRKLFLRALAEGEALDMADVDALLPPREEAGALVAQSKAFFEEAADLPIGWLKLVTANIGLRIDKITGEVFDVRDVRLDGRADGGWVSLAPIEAKGSSGSLRGFAVLDASSLPATSEISVQMRGFEPLREKPSAFDAALDLRSKGRKLGDLYAFTGAVKTFFEDVDDVQSANPGLLGPILNGFVASDSDVPRFDAQCGLVQLDFVNGRGTLATSQIFGKEGRLSARGTVNLPKNLVDLEIAAEPFEGKAQFYDAVGTLEAPAISRNDRQTPWLSLDMPKKRVCELLRKQSSAVLDGR